MDTASTDTVTGVAIDTWISGFGLALDETKQNKKRKKLAGSLIQDPTTITV